MFASISRIISLLLVAFVIAGIFIPPLLLIASVSIVAWLIVYGIIKFSTSKRSPAGPPRAARFPGQPTPGVNRYEH